jgi:hypothetical protein
MARAIPARIRMAACALALIESRRRPGLRKSDTDKDDGGEGNDQEFVMAGEGIQNRSLRSIG